MAFLCRKIFPNNEVDKIICTNKFYPYQRDLYEIGENKVVMTDHFVQNKSEIDNFEVRGTDIFVLSHRRTGSTWLSEIVWQIVNGIDFEKSKQLISQKRIPTLDVCLLYGKKEVKKHYELELKTPEELSLIEENPRIIRTHLPWELLPTQIKEYQKTPKLIYIYRDPKDVCISSFHHVNNIKVNNKFNFEDFFKIFLHGRMFYGCYWSHIQGFWLQRNRDNVLILRFEDMKNDITTVIKQISQFLNQSLTDEKIKELIDNTTIENFKKNFGSDQFYNVDKDHIRKGTVGDHKSLLTAEMCKLINDKTENLRKQHGVAL